MVGSIRFQGDHFSQLRRSLTWSKTRSTGALTSMLRLTFIWVGKRNEIRINAKNASPIHRHSFLKNFFMDENFIQRSKKTTDKLHQNKKGQHVCCPFSIVIFFCKLITTILQSLSLH